MDENLEMAYSSGGLFKFIALRDDMNHAVTVLCIDCENLYIQMQAKKKIDTFNFPIA
jgi:hypothetical protein